MIHILIYDDSPERCESLQALFSLNEEMRCLAAYHDCSHVEEDMNRWKPDVVLMDIAMPGINGIEAVRKIKACLSSVRIIMQTIFEDEEKIFQSLQAGAEGYLLKTTSAERIVQCIREVYQGGAYMTPSVALRVIRFFNKNVHDNSFNLTPREKEVLKWLSEGMSYKMVSDRMDISYFTVNSHVKRIYEKLHVHSLGEAVSLAIRNGIV